jgi:DNA-binding HxlR family transcriptional regulator
MSSVALTGGLADRDSWTSEQCPIAAALDLVGRRATFLLIREAYYGTRRFDEFARRAGFTEAVTATRLRELVASGLLERRPYQESGQRTRLEYHLTDMGKDLFPVLVGLMRWGERWVRPGEGRIAFTHAGCGAEIEAEVRCRHGHRVDLEHVRAAPKS